MGNRSGIFGEFSIGFLLGIFWGISWEFWGDKFYTPWAIP